MIMRRRFYGMGFLLASLFAGALHGDAGAQRAVQVMVHSGTGFFVNRQYLVTNAHVVQGCSRVILSSGGQWQEASVAVLDTGDDLALIRVPVPPRDIAPLRTDLRMLRQGDKVYIMGFPGFLGASGEYTITVGRVEQLKVAVRNVNPTQFFISDVVAHGNSGGPVLDAGGNVIGVVVASSVLTLTNARTHQLVSQQRLGVAISLTTLRDFLTGHGIYFGGQDSRIIMTDAHVVEHARSYIVNVQCRIPAEAGGRR